MVDREALCRAAPRAASPTVPTGWPALTISPRNDDPASSGASAPEPRHDGITIVVHHLSGLDPSRPRIVHARQRSHRIQAPDYSAQMNNPEVGSFQSRRCRAFSVVNWVVAGPSSLA